MQNINSTFRTTLRRNNILRLLLHTKKLTMLELSTSKRCCHSLYRDNSPICWPWNIVSVVTLSRVPSSLDLTLILTVGTKYGSQNFTCQLQIVFLFSFFVWHFFMFVCISVVHIMHKWPTWLHSHGRDSGYCMRVMMTLALP